MRKVMGNELEVYLFSFKLRSDGQLQVQCFSKKWHITENLERWNLGKINENKFMINIFVYARTCTYPPELKLKRANE
jgi:hypothetical protein